MDDLDLGRVLEGVLSDPAEMEKLQHMAALLLGSGAAPHDSSPDAPGEAKSPPRSRRDPPQSAAQSVKEDALPAAAQAEAARGAQGAAQAEAAGGAQGAAQAEAAGGAQGAGGKKRAPDASEPGVLPEMLKRLLGGSGSGKPGDKAALFRSLAPYLREDRRERLQKSVHLAKAARLAGAAMQEFGGGEGLGI